MEAGRYEVLAAVGEGASGRVFKARETGGCQRRVALEKVRVLEQMEEGVPAFVIREVRLLRKLEAFDHPNVVKLLDVSVEVQNQTSELTLVFEYVDQDLCAFLASVAETGLSRWKIKDIMLQLLRGLDFLHTNMLVHRDLKPQNVLVSSHGEIKIADFGLARIYSHHMALTPIVVTLWYRAPEVLLHSGYMSSVDMWSTGCIFAELFLLRPLFCGYSDIQQLQKIIDVIGLPAQEDWPTESPIPYPANWKSGNTLNQLLPNLHQEERDLLLQFLAFNPSKRVSAFEALRHTFLAEQ
ncbi:cyclin-dependent kinase 6-like isoform X1 [Scleropages formosus]|uniref:cyclin-dependent kinase 6-like isoform X1 n=1 Tax=Scleropages formosus TaxID=113540 RepID=UPI0010FAA249|nr:cyclin-dependent kinase 6-like isoform X1 [Scleropages formosus]XP_029102019.1 cyclin-dependent kinase 6-like isoform X1 [Scleropages formosus]